MVFFRENLPHPFPEGGRTDPKIHSHIKDLSPCHINEFTLGFWGSLEVQSSKNSFSGSGMVCLDERKGDSVFYKIRSFIGFPEKPPFIWKGTKLNQNQIRNGGSLEGEWQIRYIPGNDPPKRDSAFAPRFFPGERAVLRYFWIDEKVQGG